MGINLSLYKSSFPEYPETQSRTFHCKSGHNNDRMYIKRNDDGSYIAYCHHCCEHGFSPAFKDIFRSSSSVVSKRSGEAVPDDESYDDTGGRTQPEKDSFVIPREYTTDVNDMSLGAYKKFIQVVEKIPIRTILNLGICWKKSARADDLEILFPYYTDGNLSAYQVRRLSSYEKDRILTEPKYITTTNSLYEPGTVMHDPMFTGGKLLNDMPVFITEDWLSAARISMFYPALPLMGVNMSDLQTEYIAKIFPSAVVWLDNDSILVLDRARNMSKRLISVGVGTARVSMRCDPKNASPDDFTQTVFETAQSVSGITREQIMENN